MSNTRVSSHDRVKDLWDEWGSLPIEGPEEAEVECAGLLAGLGNGLRTKRLWAVRRFLRLWRQTSWFASLGHLSWEAAGGGKNIRIHLPSAFWDGASLTGGGWTWTRGLWGSCGSLYIPRSGHYLALRLPDPALAAPLFRLGLPWSGRNWEMTLRDQDAIVTFLCKIGLQDAPLKLEERAILRSVRGQANRASNCDTANIRRTLQAAEEQTRLARKIAENGLFPKLPPALRQLAEARLANPESSLLEIGQKLSPPIRKSTVKYRWGRLTDYVSRNLNLEE